MSGEALTSSRRSSGLERDHPEREQAILAEMLPMFEGMFDADRVALRTLLETKLRERAARGIEPDRPKPAADGVLADLPVESLVA